MYVLFKEMGVFLYGGKSFVIIMKKKFFYFFYVFNWVDINVFWMLIDFDWIWKIFIGVWKEIDGRGWFI